MAESFWRSQGYVQPLRNTAHVMQQLVYIIVMVFHAHALQQDNRFLGGFLQTWANTGVVL